MNLSRHHHSHRAFSLVEVTLAMAIAAVGLVSILGMLPQGLSTMQQAGDEAIKGRIHQQIMNELQMTPFNANATTSPIDDFHELELYYDDQGEEIGDNKSNPDAKGSFEHIYSARISVPQLNKGVMPASVGGASYKGINFSESGGETNDYIRPVVIEVATVGGLGGEFLWDDEKNRSMISSYQTFIVQMGHDFGAK